MKAAGLKRGVVIAMNPQTGEVLAMVSLPTYDNNLFARGISAKDFQALLKNPDKPLLNHAISAHYPPGSTYKLVTGHRRARRRQDHGRRRASRRRPTSRSGATKFYDWNHRGFGPCDIYCGFGHSSDTFFFQLAGKLGIDRLGYWAKQYGFGAPTGIDLPGRGRRASSRRTSGSRPRSARRSSRARPTRPASARATTWSPRSS